MMPYSRKISQGSIFPDGPSLPFMGFKFSKMCKLTSIYVLYNRAYFVGLIFVARLAIIHENCENWTPRKFPLYHDTYPAVLTLNCQ